MTPVARCLRKVDHASVVTDSTIVEQVGEALDELEAAYRRPSDKITALEEVLQAVSRRRTLETSPFGRFVYSSVERRQTSLARLRA
ncbi:hypothetical protein [Methylobacterium brachythecii]|uniref:Uncharacterized protein n=1 Tax=Methylobacterium brachythecii TaxID=1176177 RepID=A0A7W6F996_9HYPH|nr:hypothetical protein [Methylobacterium brachythecii]MBB3904926.1 hypothetical protein [Methylobacterium brachythecii]GLS46686.1 hypothetical protein GCM10007884_46800 [Methylobacterium brachythecii]